MKEEVEKMLEFLVLDYNRDINDPKIIDYVEKLEKYKNSNLENFEDIFKNILFNSGNKFIFRPSEIKLNTVGSYLLGSFQNYYGDVNKTCSGLYSSSIFNTDQTCQYSIWTYNLHNNSMSGMKLKNTLKVITSKAYIYVDENWKFFTKEDIITLKTEGILYATVFSTSHSQHKILIPMTSVENLPVSKENLNMDYDTSKPSYNLYFVIILILFLILFLGTLRY